VAKEYKQQHKQQPTQFFVVTGPESAGKTTLAQWLAEIYAAPLVPEVAREYLQGRTEYNSTDVEAITRLQQAAENEVLAQALASAAPVVFADTDYQILSLWWKERFAAENGEFEPASPARPNVSLAYLLCYPDLKWQPDPLRENPFDRDRLFGLHLQMLERQEAQFRVIWGQGAFRQRLALNYVEATLGEFGRKKVAL